MDGFDDLLVPTRQRLEDNPFEDPFAKRSNSPDPWASFHQTAAAYPDNAYDPALESATTTGSFVSAQTDQEDPNPLGEQNTTTASDRLPISTSPTTDEDDLPLALSASRRTPGFMESIPTEHPIPTVSETPVHQHVPTSTLQPSTPPAMLTTHAQSSDFSPTSSPLEQPTSVRTLAALAIGGETVGAWQVAQSPLSEEPHRTPDSCTDDSDDDKPLRRPSTTSERTIPIATNPVNPAQTIPTAAQPRTETGLQPVFVITVDDPQKVGDPIRSFTMYTVHTRVSICLCPHGVHAFIPTTDHVPSVPKI